MPALRILFVCGANRWRSPTAERIRLASEPRISLGKCGRAP
jgi:predicted protein tyrosine phosphatase